jgi:Ca2+-binding EF-hand superfamily protein
MSVRATPKQLLERLKDTLNKRGTRGICALGKWFRIADTNRSFDLDLEEFQVVMIRMRLGLEKEELKTLFNFFDKDRSGSIAYDEFLQGLRGELNDFRRGFVRQAFAILDTSGDGKIDLDEIRAKYSAKGHPDVLKGKKTEEEVLLEFIETFEVGDSVDGIVTAAEFENYYGNVSASIDDDKYFEVMMNSAWRLGEYAKFSNKAKGTALEVSAGRDRSSAAPADNKASSNNAQAAAAPRAPNAITVKMLKSKLQDALSKRGTRGISSLGKFFRISDRDKSGALDRDEFAVCMQRLRLPLTPEQAGTLFDAFDENRGGSIDYEEFLIGLRGELSATRKKVVGQAYKKLDLNNDGKVDLDEIRQLYSAKGHPDVLKGKKTEEEVLLEFIETFEVRGEKDGIVTPEEFENYYSNVSASIDDDKYFVVMMNSAWRMGEYANVSNKTKGTTIDSRDAARNPTGGPKRV